MRTTKIAIAALLASTTFAFGQDHPNGGGKAPAEGGKKHECKISTDAEATFAKMTKAVNGPIVRGVKEATGVVSTEMMGNPVKMNFTVKAPATVTVEPQTKAPEGGGGGMGRGGMGRGVQGILRQAFGIVRPGEEEFDAEIVKKDGKEIISETTYRDGVETGHVDVTLDANGLPASATAKRKAMGPNAGGQTVQVDTVYTWTKSGESWRLDKIEQTTPQGKPTTTISYHEANGMSLPASWKTETPRGANETQVVELTVDGKKIELKPAEKKPEAGKDAPPPAPAPGDKK